MSDRVKSEIIGNLTRKELEEIIKNIAQKTFNEEIKKEQENKSQALAATFGAWEDEREEAEIINEIYDSRNSNLSEFGKNKIS